MPLDSFKLEQTRAPHSFAKPIHTIRLEGLVFLCTYSVNLSIWFGNQIRWIAATTAPHTHNILTIHFPFFFPCFFISFYLLSSYASSWFTNCLQINLNDSHIRIVAQWICQVSSYKLNCYWQKIFHIRNIGCISSEMKFFFHA